MTQSALIKRINRKLAHRAMQLRTSRGQSQREAMGDHYVMFQVLPLIVARHVDVAQLARDMGVGE